MIAFKLFFIALLAVSAFMLLLWLIHLSIKNAGIIDVGWTLGIGFCALIYFFLGDGYFPRKMLVTAMAMFWSLRLGFYILFDRVIGRGEDPRYQELRKVKGWITSGNFILFFLFQAFLSAIFSLAFLFPAVNLNPQLSLPEAAGIVMWFIAFNGEALADRQLKQFKANPANKGKVCNAGLWKYSRHPNYFFEFLIWVSFALFALASPWGFLALSAPALIFYFLFKVTGIPATEAQSLRSKGEVYREYQRTTSVFVPWFPKRKGS